MFKDDAHRFPDNLASQFFDYAQSNPHKVALVEALKWSNAGVSEEALWTFSQLAERIRVGQLRLDRAGLRPGDRVLVLLPVSTNMYVLVAALLANGLTPVFIDPTMSRDQFLKSIKKVRPQAIFSTHAFFKYRFLLPLLWRSRLYAFNEGGFLLKDWERIEVKDSLRHPTKRNPQAETLITFTSGSTGAPKAADRRLDILYYQREISKSLWTEGDGDVELSAFPLVVLNNLVYGVTTVLPPLNYAQMDQLPLICWAQQIKNHQVTRLAASPAILHQLTRQPEEHRAHFASIKRVVTGGAPTPHWLMKLSGKFFPQAEKHVVYGSTEAEPMSAISFTEALVQEGKGYVVGRPIEEIDLRVIAPLAAAPKAGSFQPHPVAPGTCGEIVLRGPHVVERYLYNDQENERTKLKDELNQTWHRTGDTGYFDSSGRLWLTGRLNERAVIGDELADVYPLEHDLENLLETRVAVVAGQEQRACVFVQNKDLSPRAPNRTMEPELKARLNEWGMSGRWRDITVIPVDHRHFWKVQRQTLRELACQNPEL